MSNIHKSMTVILLVALLSSGCAQVTVPSRNPTSLPSQESEGNVESVRLVQSDKGRIENPQVSDVELKSLATGNSAFAFDLYRQLSGQDGNLFYSPYSISLAMAMTFAGARSETEAQIAETLHFDLPQASLHPVFNAVSQKLEGRAQSASQKGEPGFTLNIANSLWGQADFEFQIEFLDLLAENYGAGMREVDFAQSEQARQLINDWVVDETEEKIKDLIPEGALNELTRLVLANAIYFKAAWQEQFEEGFTSKEDFTLLSGERVKVDLMRQSKGFAYANGEGYQVVELPYAGESAAMVILVPDEGRFEEFEAALNAKTVEDIILSLEVKQIDLSMPKFRVESSFNLNETLSALGMPDAFSVAQADFSGMTGKPDLYISSVVHKAFVDVNEEGTEAAAATGVVMGLKSMPVESIPLRIDRPFIFLIRDRATGTILFMGRVLDPR